MDRIIISDLQARCIIGINADERREKQDVLINLTLFVDLAPAGLSDRIEDAVDYRSIKKEVYGFVEESRFFLLEALAQAIAALCLSRPPVQAVQVRVDKPAALRFARSVAVEITRSKGALP